MKFATLFILLISGCTGMLAQSNSHSEKLPWLNGEFPPKNGNYEYLVARGEGRLLREAREDAFNSFLMDLGNNAGVKVDSRTISEIKSNLNYGGNTSDYQESTTMNTAFNIEREGFKASFSKVSEYYEYVNGTYQLWELYEISQGKSFKPYIPEYTDHYGIEGAWRSAILPGWGQFHKGKTGKGIFFLSAELVSISGIIYCEMQRFDNFRKSQETTNLSIIKEYRNRADEWKLYRNIAVGAATGIYAWNVLDAALAKGKIRYAWIPDNLYLKASNYNDVCYYGFTLQF